MLCSATAGPTSESSTNGGIGATPANAPSATWIGVPSSTILLTSPMNRPSSRFTMNDGLSLTRIVVFFRPCRWRSRGQRGVVGLLALDDLEQRHHRDRVEEVETDDPPRVLSSEAISVIDSDEVLVASTHSGETIPSTSAKTFFLTPISSNTASITKSASAKTSPFSTEPVTRALSRLALSWVSRPLSRSLSTSSWT